MPQKRAKRLFWNAVLMTVATLLIRTVSVAFQITLSNRVGAEAMGLFSLISGVYGFALTLATSGIHLGVTRIVADATGEGKTASVKPAMRRAAIFALSLGTLSALLLAAGAGTIGRVWLRDVRTVKSLRLFAVTLPLLSLLSVFNGYFVAVRRVYKNAAVQVAGQAVKIWITMYLLLPFFSGGVESACVALVLGGAASEAVSFLVELCLYLTDRKKHFRASANDGAESTKKLLRIALPVALTACLRSGLITLEHILIPAGLRKSGNTHSAALVAYGSIHGMALPVILYPAALIASFSGLLIPELAESRVLGSPRRTQYMISRVWALSAFFSIGVAGILLCFSEEIGTLLYPGTQTAKYIRVLAPLIPIMYVDTATDAMMKGLGEEVYSMNVNIADAAISVLLVWILTPRFGINGYLVTVYFSEIFNTVLSVTHLLSVSRTPVRLFKWIYKPLLSVVGATAGTRLLLDLFGKTAPSAGTAVLHVTLATMLYLLLLRLTGSVGKDDLRWAATLFQKERAEEDSY